MISKIKKIKYRSIQYAFKYALKVIKYKEPEMINGAGAIEKLPSAMKNRNISNPLVVASRTLYNSGALDKFLSLLKEENMDYVLYTAVKPNPTIDNINDCASYYTNNKCDAITVIGGGSPIDCAKVTSAVVNGKNPSIKKLKGYMKVKGPICPLFICPTTAGSGSETTVCAVVTDSKTHDKYAINDFKFIPDIEILDANLTLNLPKSITAQTGMDALTHALEAYIGIDGSKYTDELSEKAIKMIFENLEKAYTNGHNINARENMLLASNYAGKAFTRAFVGYVHAIAHALGGLYNVSHGLANAIILPYILEYYGESIYDKMHRIGVITGLSKESSSKEESFRKVVQKIRNMNSYMGIPDYIEELKEKDFEIIAKHTLKEANPMYPVPKIMDYDDCIKILSKLTK